jgi:hypothetical protein
MMFRRPNKLALLARADKAEATAEKALNTATKARAEAYRQRILADRIEVEENATRLEREAVSAELVATQAAQDFQLAQQTQNNVDAALKAADRNVELTWQYLDNRKTIAKDAVSLAKEARAEVPVTKDESA